MNFQYKLFFQIKHFIKLFKNLHYIYTNKYALISLIKRLISLILYKS